MYTAHTYQDWLDTPEEERLKMALTIIMAYKSSREFRDGLTALSYFNADNEEIRNKMLLRPITVSVKDEKGRMRKKAAQNEVKGNQVHSNFLYRFVTQEIQTLLSNGVTLKDESAKNSLGVDFDTLLQQMGESAVLLGAAYGYWNVDHLEPLYTVVDAGSGFVALLDEITGSPMVGIHFWQIDHNRPMYFRLFETDGVTICKRAEADVEIVQPKRAYKVTTSTDSLGTEIIFAENYGSLPIFPLYGNPTKMSILTPAIKSKIDLYDRILSDFGDNLDRANEVYWVLNNFGGTMDEIAEMMEQISRIKVVSNISDGTGSGSTAEPHTIEVPYAARKEALDLLRKALYADCMALDMDALTGGSLTNVAILAATEMLNCKCDRFEWQVRDFVLNLLKFNGLDTNEITFKRVMLSNRSEIVQDIYTMRSDLDRRTALKLNPYIDPEEIDGIIENLDAEAQTGIDDMERLSKQVETLRNEPE